MKTTIQRFDVRLQDLIWGGRKLASKYGKGDGSHLRIAESWETCESVDDLPVLLKWIDTDLPTSVHVHPDKEMTETLGYPCENESEIWVVAEAEPESRLGIGFSQEVTREEVLRALNERTLELLINNFEAQPGDCFVVPPGTIHYLDGGITLLEVAAKSNVTLRLYDWLRDVTTAREVSVAESLTAMNFSASTPLRTFLPNCEESFRVSHGSEKIDLRWREITGEMTWCHSEKKRFITLLSGEGVLNRSEKVCQGESLLIPEEGIILKAGPTNCTILEIETTEQQENNQ